eukprot:356424_1
MADATTDTNADQTSTEMANLIAGQNATKPSNHTSPESEIKTPDTFFTNEEPEVSGSVEEAEIHDKQVPQDIYSFGVSYAYKYKKLPIDLCGCMCIIFVLQICGVVSIVWSSEVRTSTDVILRFDTYDIGLCLNATGLYYNQPCDAPLFDFNRNYTDGASPYKAFEVHLQEGDGQFDGIVAETDDPDINWDYFAFGYAAITVISLAILSIKVMNAAMCPLSLFMISLHATSEWKDRWKLKWMMRFVSGMHLVLVLFAWGVGYKDIAFYIPKYGLGNPSNVILGPISLIFILEIDHWVIDIVRLRYAPTDYTFMVTKNFEKNYNSIVFSFAFFFNAFIIAILIALFYGKWNLFNDAGSEAQQTWIYVFVGCGVYAA